MADARIERLVTLEGEVVQIVGGRSLLTYSSAHCRCTSVDCRTSLLFPIHHLSGSSHHSFELRQKSALDKRLTPAVVGVDDNDALQSVSKR